MTCVSEREQAAHRRESEHEVRESAHAVAQAGSLFPHAAPRRGLLISARPRVAPLRDYRELPLVLAGKHGGA